MPQNTAMGMWMSGSSRGGIGSGYSRSGCLEFRSPAAAGAARIRGNTLPSAALLLAHEETKHVASQTNKLDHRLSPSLFMTLTLTVGY